ncbi:MAG TPA: acyltransferase [Kofleriaceae bacterium]|nr:acyltransferase [Kofleriaceae bacterium]
MDPDRISQFDGLRAFAFLSVFVHHALRVPLLWMGVDQFFVLSGFLITRNLLSLRERATVGGAFGVFYYRRVLRIIPPYYLAITAILLVGPWVADSWWYYSFLPNVRDSLYTPHKGALDTMWSIGVEEQFYLVWPLLVLVLPRRALAPTFVAVVLAAPVCRVLCMPLGINAVYRLMPCRMDLLAMGALLAFADSHDSTWIAKHRRAFVAAAAAALAVFAALSLGDHHFRTNENTLLFDVVGFSLSGVFFTGILAWVRGAQRGVILSVLRNRWLRHVGTVSYMAYLIHMLCLDVASRAGGNRYVVAAVALALTIAASSLSWFVLEQPLLRLRHLVKAHPKRTA